MEPTSNLIANLYIDSRGHLIKKVPTGASVYDYFIGQVLGVKLTTSGEPMLCTFK